MKLPMSVIGVPLLGPSGTMIIPPSAKIVIRESVIGVHRPMVVWTLGRPLNEFAMDM